MSTKHQTPQDVIRQFAVKDLERPDRLILDHPPLRYLTSEQALEWLKIGSSINVHTQNSEILLIQSRFELIKEGFCRKVAIVDFGCGDGAKASKLIQDLTHHGHEVVRYCPVDVSSTLISSAVERVVESTDVKDSQCTGICSSFEEVSQVRPFWATESNDNTTVLGLFLGNTFNNYSPLEAVKLLHGLVAVCDCLLLGVKVRRDSSPSEVERILQQYRSYGDAFTYSFGHTLGLDSGSMTRIVEYNVSLNRIEISIHIDNTLDKTMYFNNGIKDLLVCCSYKPTADEIVARLLPLFLFQRWSLDDVDDVVFRIQQK